MDREKFLAEVDNKLRELFKASKISHRLPDYVKHRCEGFMEAGVFLGLVKKTELRTLMESIHLEVFGKTIDQAKQEKANLWKDDAIDYSIYDLPPSVRAELR